MEGYPKVRDLQKMLVPILNLDKINAILRYLKNSKKIEIDLDGNIIWIRGQKTSNHLTIAETANISPEFVDYYSRMENRGEN